MLRTNTAVEALIESCVAAIFQVLALDVILANGTRRVFTNETDPFLMKVGASQKLMWFGTSPNPKP